MGQNWRSILFITKLLSGETGDNTYTKARKDWARSNSVCSINVSEVRNCALHLSLNTQNQSIQATQKIVFDLKCWPDNLSFLISASGGNELLFFLLLLLLFLSHTLKSQWLITSFLAQATWPSEVTRCSALHCFYARTQAGEATFILHIADCYGKGKSGRGNNMLVPQTLARKWSTSLPAIVH